MSVLKKGDEGPLVTKLQEKLGIEAVGKFGPKTETALKDWQQANGFNPDGVAGPFTLAKLGVESLPVFKLDKLKGHVPDHVIAQIPDTASKFNITTPLRLAHFLAQCSHESIGFTDTDENLGYSAKGLMSVFKKYFPTVALANAYQKQPEKIANKIYASRMGNGPETSGDGYKYRGRGYIQLTGKDNYLAFDKTVVDNIVGNPDLVATKYPLASAAFFFNNNNLWKICDQGATTTVVTNLTKRVNGGSLGLEERIKDFQEYYKLLS